MNTYCSCRGSELGSHTHIRQLIPTCHSSSRGSNILFWIIQAPALTHVQTHINITKDVLNRTNFFDIAEFLCVSLMCSCSKFLIVLLLHFCIHTWCVSVACMLRTEDSCIELVLSYLYVGSRDRTRVIKFAWQLLYLILSLFLS